MAKEHFIIGKHDDAHHDGLYANTKRLQEAEANLTEFLSQQTDQSRSDTTPTAPQPPVAPATEQKPQTG